MTPHGVNRCTAATHPRFQESRVHSWNPTNATNPRSGCALAPNKYDVPFLRPGLVVRLLGELVRHLEEQEQRELLHILEAAQAGVLQHAGIAPGSLANLGLVHCFSRQNWRMALTTVGMVRFLAIGRFSGLGLTVRADDSDELVRQVAKLADGSVDTLGD